MSNLSRRSLVAGAASLPALAAGAAVAIEVEPDPIFAAIEWYKSAWDAFDDFGGSESSPQYDVLEQVFQQAQDALFATVPTTPDGMKALISFCVNDKTISASELPDEVLNTLHKSASMMARRS